jgi:hypothetical protein
LAPREDGLHGETQMSNDNLDANIAKGLAIGGVALLLEILKRFAPVTATFGTGEDPTGALPTTAAGITTGTAHVWKIIVTPNPRNTASDAQISALAHNFVLAHILMGWYRLVGDDEAEWLRQKGDAALRLQAALMYQAEPEM